jgi:hypothetical protein
MLAAPVAANPCISPQRAGLQRLAVARSADLGADLQLLALDVGEQPVDARRVEDARAEVLR